MELWIKQIKQNIEETHSFNLFFSNQDSHFETSHWSELQGYA